MKYLKIIFDFYINSSLHVALSVYALLRITEFYFDLPYNETLNYFIFYGTITGYNFVKYAGIAKLHHMSLTKNLRLIQIFSLLCFLMMCFYLTLLNIKVLLYFIPFSLLTFFYAVPVLKGVTKNLRNIGTLKIFVIALVWSGVTALIPLASKYKLGVHEVLFSVQRFLFVVVLTLPFDIRDMRYDKKYLQTIPQIIGVERAKKFGSILLLITVVIEFFITPNSSLKFGFMIVFFTLLLFLQKAKTKQSKYYASFWIEGIPIFWFLLLSLMK
ncbi:UbiA prenyltransferase family protein [Tenacibaculum jejuense]|uniref:Prenyltransferase n=1 Tax=Tenacibaculum jejuense TaxID=584609 RepID=A0A238U788_9FLAO|nr:hypothetical protein [Tenacibaculum jejuense]SNR15061.1 conserved membrane protein of unknown function [Tenacibaculum jejuense]